MGNPDTDESGYVKYIDDPLSFPPNLLELTESERLEIMRKALYTKFKHWQYEHEIRVWAPLQHEENGLYFLEFDQKLRIVEVIIGARCKVPRSEIIKALGAAEGDVKILKARAAYDRFQMVEDKDAG
jgi:hypothetical protein